MQTWNNGQLQQDGRWDASHYGNLEQFIYDYLTGGSSAGESVRLKLQTPLFVAEALAQAAHRQLTDELETATQVQLTPCYGLLLFWCFTCVLSRGVLQLCFVRLAHKDLQLVCDGVGAFSFYPELHWLLPTLSSSAWFMLAGLEALAPPPPPPPPPHQPLLPVPPEWCPLAKS